MRTWARLGVAGVVVVAGVAIALVATDSFVELQAPESGEVAAEWLPDGTPVFVTLQDDEVAVVDARSPHWLDEGLEVYVGFCESSLEAWEPYSASIYDHRGLRVGGPAPGGLASYEAELVDGGRVRVGPRRAPADRAEANEEPAHVTACRGDDLVRHHADAEATTPEALAAEAESDESALVLAAVERVDADPPGLLLGAGFRDRRPAMRR